MINESTEAFKNSDFNQCLSKARIRLETIVRTIAIDKYNINDRDGFNNAFEPIFLKLKEENPMSYNDAPPNWSCSDNINYYI